VLGITTWSLCLNIWALISVLISDTKKFPSYKESVENNTLFGSHVDMEVIVEQPSKMVKKNYN
jgi:hypothetical protein